ncbi:MAG: DUF4258 domain-containing protein [Nanoarchaeota archaeon]
MRLVMSRHALEQAQERGISISEIKKTIQQGAKFLQEKDKIVSDFMHLRVVYKMIKSEQFVITVMIRK